VQISSHVWVEPIFNRKLAPDDGTTTTRDGVGRQLTSHRISLTAGKNVLQLSE
jgi:hypothetical protein